MIDRHVFIPTRGRYEGIGRLCDVWLNKGFQVHLSVEPHEAYKYSLHTPSGVEIIPLDAMNAGIAYNRSKCVMRAHRRGYESIILADDDIKPSTRRADNMVEILEACRHPKILGMTARYSYHDLCLGPDIKDMDDIILLSTGTFRLVGLNVENVIKLGNYDIKLEYAEDCDLFLRGLKAGYPWLIHLGTWANSIGTRYQPGGMLDFTKKNGYYNLDHAKCHWHQDLHKKWPEVTNAHTEKCKGKQNCIKVYWKKAYDLYLPDWRRWSELDGGDLQRYIDGES